MSLFDMKMKAQMKHFNMSWNVSPGRKTRFDNEAKDLLGKSQLIACIVFARKENSYIRAAV